MITKNEYERTTEQKWSGVKVRTLRELQNGTVMIPKGTICTIKRKQAGFTLITEACQTCGVSVYITRVPHYDLEKVDSKNTEVIK